MSLGPDISAHGHPVVSNHLVADRQLSAAYANMGFQPHWPVVECERSFTVADMVDSLVSSRMHDLKPITIGTMLPLLPDVATKIQVVVTSLTAVFEPCFGHNGFPLGYNEWPFFRFEGRILPEILEFDTSPKCLRGYVSVSEDGEVGQVSIQRAN